jgi:hypothetical protein
METKEIFEISLGLALGVILGGIVSGILERQLLL